MKLKRSFRSIVAVSLAAVLSMTCVQGAFANQNSTVSCFAASCNGQSPVGLCDGDAVTVAFDHVNTLGDTGFLELRYSPSCQANWGRFTPKNNIARLLLQPVQFGRVTVWNPGEMSYGWDYESLGDNILLGTSWSYMTDGTKVACTGVEPFVKGGSPQAGRSMDDLFDHTSQGAGDQPHSLGWYWGPCL